MDEHDASRCTAHDEPELHVVTGAFGYVGRYIARRLLADNQRVRTLTAHPNRPNPFRGQVAVYPLCFDDIGDLAISMLGAVTLYNTYWVRFEAGRVTFDTAVRNSSFLITAARWAGVRRIVHISITNPSIHSSLPYFRGKAEVESIVAASGVSHAIIRPTVVFGSDGILINNIAWLMRRFPIFAVPGSGDYRVQPVFAEDLAELAVDAGQRQDTLTIDAVGPEIYTFTELVRLIADAVKSRARIVRVPRGVALFTARVLGLLVRDVILTRDEAEGLMSSLLVSEGPPTARTSFKRWLGEHADSLGVRYLSELERHYR
ncbi:MAG: SDR family oxidoreductase [Phycisphaerae bacterium]